MARHPLKRSYSKIARSLTRAWRSLEALSNFVHFLVIVPLPVAAIFSILFVGNGFKNGWRQAFDVTLAITSPWDAKIESPLLAWPLAVAAWLIVPVIAGAVIGYAVTSSLDRRRGVAQEQHPPTQSSSVPADASAAQVSGEAPVSREAAQSTAPTGARVAQSADGPPQSVGSPASSDAPQQTITPSNDRSTKGSKGPRLIPSLQDRAKTMAFGVPDAFVNYFVALHDWDWSRAQDHWEREVVHALTCTDVAGPRDPYRVAMRLAVVASFTLLWKARDPDYDEQISHSSARPKGYCPSCAT